MEKTKKVVKTQKVTSKQKKIKKENFFVGVKKELALVSWPSKKNVMKYTIATLIFVLFVTGFFLVLNLLLSVIKGWFV